MGADGGILVPLRALTPPVEAVVGVGRFGVHLSVEKGIGFTCSRVSSEMRHTKASQLQLQC